MSVSSCWWGVTEFECFTTALQFTQSTRIVTSDDGLLTLQGNQYHRTSPYVIQSFSDIKMLLVQDYVDHW